MKSATFVILALCMLVVNFLVSPRGIIRLRGNQIT